MNKAGVMDATGQKTVCYLCGGARLTRREGSVRDDPDAQIHQCDTCGLVFLSGLKSKDLTEFYQAGGMREGKWLYFDESDKETEHITWKKDMPVERPVYESGIGYSGARYPNGHGEAMMGN